MRRMYSENQVKEITKELIEGGQVDNAKPIYWHSCTLKRVNEGTLIFYLDFIILNNDPTPITLTSLYNWLKDNPDIEIKIVQGYSQAFPSSLVSYLFYYPDVENAISIACIKLDSGTVQYDNKLLDNAILTDNGVNKIN